MSLTSAVAPSSIGIDSVHLNSISNSMSTKVSNKSDSLSIGRSPDEVAQEFEGVFTSMLLKSMRTSMSEEGLFGSDSSDTYGGIFDMFMSRHMSQGSPLGIGQMVKSYMENQAQADSGM